MRRQSQEDDITGQTGVLATWLIQRPTRPIGRKGQYARISSRPEVLNVTSTTGRIYGRNPVTVINVFCLANREETIYGLAQRNPTINCLQEIPGIVRFICIESGPLVGGKAGLPSIQLDTVFFELLGKRPDIYGHGAGPHAGPAVRTPSRTMIGTQKMEGPNIDRILALAHPLWL